MQRELFTQQIPQPSEAVKPAVSSPANDALADWLHIEENWLPRSQQLLTLLRNTIDWQQPEVKVYNQWHRIPRMQAWFGDEGMTYRYSGVDHIATGWPKCLLWVCQKLNQDTQGRYNSVLLNRYRDGLDKMGWHADNEPELGVDPAVAIVSLGHSRDIQFKSLATNETTNISLTSGSLLLMKPGMQSRFHHQIPVRRRVAGERISLTFRQVKSQ